MAFFKQEKVKPYLTKSIEEAIGKDDLYEVEKWINYDAKLLNDKFWSSDDICLISPLDLAVKKNKIKIASFLADKGATINKTIFKKYATNNEIKEILKNVKFSKNGHPPRKPNAYTDLNSIFDAIQLSWDGKNIELIQEYIDHDPNSPNEKNTNSTSALEYAVFSGHPEALKILIKNDAKADEKIFTYAAFAGFDTQRSIQKLIILSQYGYAKNPTICSQALLKAVEENKNKDNLQVVEHILTNYVIDWDYCEIRTYNKINFSLIELVLEKSVSAFSLLCKYGKNKVTDKLFSDGNTIMHRIALGLVNKFVQLEVLNLLFQYNANPTIRHYTTNATAYQIARVKNSHDIAEEIKKSTTTKYQGKIKDEDTIAVQDLQVKEALHPKTQQAQQQPIVEFDINAQFFVKYKDLLFGKTLGQGGFGKVYLAEWHSIPVAVKMLKGEFTEAPLLNFVDEANLFHKLRHKNIVQMYGICNEPGNYAIVMEYLEKGSLFNVLHSSENLDWKIRYNISLDISKGLEYLHNNNIVHRDFKSLNVLLTSTLQAKICDFGLSRIKQESSKNITTTDQAVGTIAWMAPELFVRKPEYKFSADIYSLAVVFWEIATRKIPWADASIGAIIVMLSKNEREEDPPSDTPIAFAKLIKTCWQTKPEERPKINDVVKDLELNRL